MKVAGAGFGDDLRHNVSIGRHSIRGDGVKTPLVVVPASTTMTSMTIEPPMDVRTAYFYTTVKKVKGLKKTGKAAFSVSPSEEKSG